MKNIIRIIILLLITAAAICGFLFAREYKTAMEEISEYANIQNEHTSIINPSTNESSSDTPLSETEESPELVLPYVDVDFDALLLINPDTVGWIAIPDTVVSYPVVQTTNNVRYLNISFEGRSSKAGTVFADRDNNILSLDTNTIIYGHNMGAGRDDMFSTLLSYKDREYYESNRYIQFDTIHQLHGFWKVFAVIELDVHNTDFIPQQRQFQCEADFMDWIAQAMELSVHDTDIEISMPDYILTLSTCDRSRFGRSGRLIILAARL